MASDCAMLCLAQPNLGCSARRNFPRHLILDERTSPTQKILPLVEAKTDTSSLECVRENSAP
ncbi:hypothetical protein DR64_2242 [Paraburkholderia xenovorans LB400]|nr:hypothetical protein DR64_2242 [Paraburkholderia xenovorans LB400]